MNKLILLLVLTTILSRADNTYFCTRDDKPEFYALNEKTYQNCGERCECDAVETLCFMFSFDNRGRQDYELVVSNFNDANRCTTQGLCLCNSFATQD